MGADERIQALAEEFVKNPKEAAFLVSRDTIQALLNTAEKMQQIQEENKEVTELMMKAHKDVMRERLRQNRKWGTQRHHHSHWITLALEEFGEVAQAVQHLINPAWVKDTDTPPDQLYAEWIQLSAVSLSAAEQAREEMHSGQVEPPRAFDPAGSD